MRSNTSPDLPPLVRALLAGRPILHNELIVEYLCAGELIPQPQQSTPTARALKCAACGTKITYTPDSSWVAIVLAG